MNAVPQLPPFPSSSTATQAAAANKHPPLDSQSAQNLFSSRASRELSTVWYLSTSFTDLPVIMAKSPATAAAAPPPPPPPPPLPEPAGDGLCRANLWRCRAYSSQDDPFPTPSYSSSSASEMGRLATSQPVQGLPEMRRSNWR